MSALGTPLEVDLEANVATVSLFVDGECHLWEDGDGWRGFAAEDGRYYWVDTRPPEKLRLRVGEGAVRTTIQRYLDGGPVAAPTGRVAP